MHFPHYKNEAKHLSGGFHFVAGCDEVGIGPLAGPVVAAACILRPETIGKNRTKNKWYYRVRDSKTTSEEERQNLVKEILEHTFTYGIGVVWQEDIDKLNIHNAALEAMRLATEEMLGRIKVEPSQKILLFLDGRFKIPNLSKNFNIEQKNIIKGDAEVLSISAASIIAKVHRDNIMHELDKKFPDYGFAKHKGYNTREHQNALRKLGVTTLHRRSFLRKGWLANLI